MSKPTTNGHANRVTLSEERVEKIVHEALKPYPNRRELMLTVSVALLGGQTVAALVAGYAYHDHVQHAAMRVVSFIAGF